MSETMKKLFVWFSITIFFVFSVYTSIKVLELPPSYGTTVSSLAIESLLKYKQQFNNILSIIFYLRFPDVLFILITGFILFLALLEKRTSSSKKIFLSLIKKIRR